MPRHGGRYGTALAAGAGRAAHKRLRSARARRACFFCRLLNSARARSANTTRSIKKTAATMTLLQPMSNITTLSPFLAPLYAPPASLIPEKCALHNAVKHLIVDLNVLHEKEFNEKRHDTIVLRNNRMLKARSIGLPPAGGAMYRKRPGGAGVPYRGDGAMPPRSPHRVPSIAGPRDPQASPPDPARTACPWPLPMA